MHFFFLQIFQCTDELPTVGVVSEGRDIRLGVCELQFWCSSRLCAPALLRGYKTKLYLTTNLLNANRVLWTGC